MGACVSGTAYFARLTLLLLADIEWPLSGFQACLWGVVSGCCGSFLDRKPAPQIGEERSGPCRDGHDPLWGQARAYALGCHFNESHVTWVNWGWNAYQNCHFA